MDNNSLASLGDGDRSTNVVAFFVGFLRNPQQVGSVVPSSRFLERRILDAADLAEARCVVELGPGTGGTTRALLGTLPADAVLLAIDTSPQFIQLLQEIGDPRLLAHQGSAEDLVEILAHYGLGAPDAIVSGIPFSTMPAAVGRRIVAAIRDVLPAGGRFVAYQFRDEVATLTQPILGHPASTLEWRNLPPMRVYRWLKEGAVTSH